ncbi:hypothetical protein EVAR_86659_1 [Eumeta japonica]|uniref:Uncharacterized protein n=1 Tax=Eumeta variegata TaxID=151549 RepID=A0A4C1Z4G3_EUMVA|nr:hypothetical protein EVAR_86659_1 [Eumeta japonica]
MLYYLVSYRFDRALLFCIARIPNRRESASHLNGFRFALRAPSTSAVKTRTVSVRGRRVKGRAGVPRNLLRRLSSRPPDYGNRRRPVRAPGSSACGLSTASTCADPRRVPNLVWNKKKC